MKNLDLNITDGIKRVLSGVNGNIDFLVLTIAIGIFIPDMLILTFKLSVELVYLFNINWLKSGFTLMLPTLAVFAFIIFNLIILAYKSLVHRIKENKELVSASIVIFSIALNAKDFYIFSQLQIIASLFVVVFGMILFSLFRKSSIDIGDVLISLALLLISYFDWSTWWTVASIVAVIKIYTYYAVITREENPDVVNTYFGLSSTVLLLVKKLVLR